MTEFASEFISDTNELLRLHSAASILRQSGRAASMLRCVSRVLSSMFANCSSPFSRVFFSCCLSRYAFAAAVSLAAYSFGSSVHSGSGMYSLMAVVF